MGLDEFISDDEDDGLNTSNSSSSSDKSSNDDSVDFGETDEIQPPDTDMDFYNPTNQFPENLPMEREGAMSEQSMSDLAQMKEDDIRFDEDHVKLYAPVFYIFIGDREYDPGMYYQLHYDGDGHSVTWDGRVVVCMGAYSSRVGNMNKEVALFEAGTTDKSEAMESMKSKLGDDVDPDTQMTMYFFSDAFMLRDLAQASNEYREGSVINRDKIVSNVLHANVLQHRVDNDDN
jgi:hypothetical protein